jgi:hypothetical protein
MLTGKGSEPLTYTMLYELWASHLQLEPCHGTISLWSRHLTELFEIFPAGDRTVGNSVARIARNEIKSVVMKSCRRSRLHLTER